MGKPSKSRPVVAMRPDGTVYSSHRVPVVYRDDEGNEIEGTTPTNQAKEILKFQKRKAKLRRLEIMKKMVEKS